MAKWIQPRLFQNIHLTHSPSMGRKKGQTEPKHCRRENLVTGTCTEISKVYKQI